jgi:C1A family cysteine protease
LGVYLKFENVNKNMFPLVLTNNNLSTACGIAFTAFVTNAVSASFAAFSPDTFRHQFESFMLWKNRYGKEYSSIDEEVSRFEIWSQASDKVTRHNRNNYPWSLSMNEFSDMTSDEFKSKTNGLVPPTATFPGRYVNMPYVDVSDLPESVDWRAKDVVNPVKNQAQCGSCWAFSAIAALETQYALRTGNLTSFSEQNLVDCVKNVQTSNGDCCFGCEGGLMNAAYQYIIDSQRGTDDLENNYSYTGVDGDCDFQNDGPGLGNVKEIHTLPSGSQKSLEKAVAEVGVIAVGVSANEDWQLYSGGVYVPDPVTGCSSDPSQLDHGVAVVGYNTDSFPDANGNMVVHNYWIVRNSWDTDWGIDGYMYLSRDVDNACGIANFASYPVLGPVTENQCLNSHPQCPQEVCYTPCPCSCFRASSVSPCDCSAAICTC